MIERITEAARITKVLGKGNSYQSIITSATLALISLFYVYTVGSYFKIIIYPLIHGITYSNTFFNFYLFNVYFDHIIIVSGTILWLELSIRHKAKLVTVITYLAIMVIAIATKIDLLLEIEALISIPFIISLLIYNKFSFTRKQIVNTYPNSLFINYVALIGIVIGIIGVIISLSPIFSIQPDSMPLGNYSYNLFLFFSSFSPVLILLLISCLPVKLFVNGFISAILKIKNKKIINLPVSTHNTNIKPRFKLIYLLLFTLLSIAVTLIPHYPTINSDNHQISVDTKYYVKWVNTLLHANNSQEFIQQAFIFQSRGDRAFTLIFFSAIAKIVNGDLFNVIEYLPVILAPLLVLVVYFLTRELTSDDVTSLFASFLTAVSFQVLIGIYAGFYAN